MTFSNFKLPIFLTIFLPLSLTFIHYSWGIFYPEHVQPFILGEFGIIENATVSCLFISMFLVLKTFLLAYKHHSWFSISWLACLFLGCVYFMGEELSWGQHFIGWNTPEVWKIMNYQNETNIHNFDREFMGSYFSKLPKTFLTSIVILSGTLIPLSRKFVSPLNHWVWPPRGIWCVSLLIILTSTSKYFAQTFPQITEYLPEITLRKASEMRECLIAVFIMLYVVVLGQTWKKKAERFGDPNGI